MVCNPLISDPFVFPRRPENRAGLPRIAYRIGRYADFVEAIKRGVDAASELAAWTHREPDDPGIALIEGAAILGDILTFYQEHYATRPICAPRHGARASPNWCGSPAIGLLPALEAAATFAFAVKGNDPVTIRAGFPQGRSRGRAGAGGLPDGCGTARLPALVALQSLSAAATHGLAAGTTVLELQSVAGASDAFSLAAFELKAGDRLMLIPNEAMWSVAGTPFASQQTPQVVTVAKVTRILDRVVIDLDKPLALAWNSPARAYRLGRTFRHFGHNAPASLITNTPSSGTITGSSTTPPGSSATSTTHTSTYGYDAAWYTSLAKTDMPLDIEVNDCCRRHADRAGQGAFRWAFDAGPVPGQAQGRRAPRRRDAVGQSGRTIDHSRTRRSADNNPLVSCETAISAICASTRVKIH
jgi:hypothetical protein